MRSADFVHPLQIASGDIQLFLIGEPSTGGSTLVIRLSNRSDRAITYNLCFSTLERRSADDWNTAQVGPAGGVCTAAQRRLEPDASADGVFALADSLPSGTYRLETSARFEGERRSFRLNTPSFTLK